MPRQSDACLIAKLQSEYDDYHAFSDDDERESMRTFIETSWEERHALVMDWDDADANATPNSVAYWAGQLLGCLSDDGQFIREDYNYGWYIGRALD